MCNVSFRPVQVANGSILQQILSVVGLLCLQDIPPPLPPVFGGIRTLNESPVDDHKTHLEGQASKRSDQT